MGEAYKFYNPDGIYFVTSAVVQWVNLFTRPRYKDILLDSLAYCQSHKGLNLHAYCIMTNHIHLIVSRNGKDELSAIMRDFKKFTSRQCFEAMGQGGESREAWLSWIFKSAGRYRKTNKNVQIWQHSNHPVELTNNEMIEQRLNYLHQNPVKAGFVDAPEDWLYSSARDYAGAPGLIEVDLLD
jgi:REP element-mobilizing transposase RayT